MREIIEGQRRWFNDPRAFVREVLKATPDPWQDDALHAIATGQRIAQKASKGPGKSTVLSWAAWWYLETRPHPKVVATSITADNLRDGLWAEMAKWQARSPLLKREFTWNAERIVYNGAPETWFMSARTWSKSAAPQQQADTLAGLHSDFLMFIVDEAGGIPDAVVAAAEAGLANAVPGSGREAKLVLAGNPTHLSGPLYRACTRERRLWSIVTINGDPDNPKRSPRIDVAWARAQIEKYGREHPWVIVNVFGEFPPGQANTLIGVDVAERAAQRTLGKPLYMEEAKVLGVDVARFGDDRTVIAPRQGNALFRLHEMRSLDTMEVAGQVSMMAERWQPDAIFVDTVGVGAGVFDRLKQLGFKPIAVEGAGVPVDRKWANKRAECWGLMAEWVKHAMIPNDSELITELCAPTYWFNAAGRLQLEAKDDLKTRGLSSPDKADAVSLTFALPVVAAHHRADLAAANMGSAKHEWNPFTERKPDAEHHRDWNPFD
jgi:phage terminase large subunit